MKLYNTNQNVGNVKYLVNYHDGVRKYNDGSMFFDVKTFKNKKEFEKFQKELIADGYVYGDSSFNVGKGRIQFEIVCHEGESLVKTSDLSEVKESFLSYIRDTQQEYIDNDDKSKEEVDEFISSLKESFGDISHLNEVLNDYGFYPLNITNHAEIRDSLLKIRDFLDTALMDTDYCGVSWTVSAIQDLHHKGLIEEFNDCKFEAIAECLPLIEDFHKMEEFIQTDGYDDFIKQFKLANTNKDKKAMSHALNTLSEDFSRAENLLVDIFPSLEDGLEAEINTGQETTNNLDKFNAQCEVDQNKRQSIVL